jgi:hypothetical protein
MTGCKGKALKMAVPVNPGTAFNNRKKRERKW